MNENPKDRLHALLALEYNCTPEDFSRKENVLTLPALREGRRRYSDEPYFFHMATEGNNAVITAHECLHAFLREYIRDKKGHWLFELPNLRPIEAQINRFGYALSGTFHMFLPVFPVVPKGDFPVQWFYDSEIHAFYGDARFPNAIAPSFHPNRPDRIVVCACVNGSILGMAGCSEDAPGWMQIGIDVLEPYRSQGIGSYLVSLLKNRILEHGWIPFYGTGVSNYHSWNIALNCGFRPAWVEIGARKL